MKAEISIPEIDRSVFVKTDSEKLKIKVLKSRWKQSQKTAKQLVG